MPRAGLTADRVVAAAEVLADEVGLGQLTLAGLADRLGVRQPSLYKHIESMAGLQRSIALRAKGQLADVLARAAAGRARGDAIHAMADAYRGWALLHPGRYQAAQVAPVLGDAEDEVVSWAVVEICAAVLGAYQLEGDDAIDAIRALRSTLHGFVALEASGAFRLGVDVDRSFQRTIRGLVVALAHWTDAEADRPAG